MNVSTRSASISSKGESTRSVICRLLCAGIGLRCAHGTGAGGSGAGGFYWVVAGSVCVAEVRAVWAAWGRFAVDAGDKALAKLDIALAA